MWAGSRLHFHAPVQIGEFLNRESSVKSLEEKNGRSGRLAFVTLSHRFVSDGGSLVVEEEQDIVYREPATGEARRAAPTLARTDESWQRLIVPTEAMLFRYYALTFNAHRIHYDRSYAREQEGYPDLVVHGPLLATLLMELLCQNLPATRVTNFSFRALSPLFIGQPFHVCGSLAATGPTADLWIRDQQVAVAMTATAGIAQ
jgi:3-methylfumaryl-CoA hydratase